jgi:hypothetical protein
MEANHKPPSDISVQKLVALSLIGYLEVLKQRGLVESDINYIFKPMQAVKRMAQLNFDVSIRNAMYQLDEVEALHSCVDQAVFAKAVDKLLLPLMAFCRKTSTPNDGSEAAITRLTR